MELITRRQDVEHACYIPGCSLIVHPRTDSIGRPEFMHRNFLGMRIQPNGGNIRKLSRMVLMHAFGTRAAKKFYGIILYILLGKRRRNDRLYVLPVNIIITRNEYPYICGVI